MTWGDYGLVTGAGSGIGRALCEQASRRGMHVIACDVRADAAEATAEMLRSAGGRASSHACDVADSAAVGALADEVRAQFGRLNLVFNNAGVMTSGPLVSTSERDFAWMLSVNVGGVFNGVQAFVPLLREAASRAEPARLVNTGSESSLGVPTDGVVSAYTATKHAVLGLSDVLRRDLQVEGVAISVSVLCPGIVATEIMDARRARQGAFGGPQAMDPQMLTMARKIMAEHGLTPERTAELCFEGLERGDFIIVTDTRMADMARVRCREVEAALVQAARSESVRAQA